VKDFPVWQHNAPGPAGQPDLLLGVESCGARPGRVRLERCMRARNLTGTGIGLIGDSNSRLLYNTMVAPWGGAPVDIAAPWAEQAGSHRAPGGTLFKFRFAMQLADVVPLAQAEFGACDVLVLNSGMWDLMPYGGVDDMAWLAAWLRDFSRAALASRALLRPGRRVIWRATTPTCAHDLDAQRKIALSNDRIRAMNNFAQQAVVAAGLEWWDAWAYVDYRDATVCDRGGFHLADPAAQTLVAALWCRLCHPLPPVTLRDVELLAALQSG
jgi:hypothetical protein